MRTLPASLAVAASVSVLAIAAPAMADASAWVFVGSGALGWTQAENPGYVPRGTLMIDVGAGTDPRGSVIFGGLLRIQPIFAQGTDVSLLARFCNRSFQAGDWGFAIDAGGFARTWGVVTAGFSGSASLGLPLGFQLTAMTELGLDRAYSFGVVAGIDVLRLTVYRQILKNWWQNPSPSWTSTPSTQSAAGGGPSSRF